MPNKGLAKIKAEWIRWLKSYGADRLFDSMLESIQDAESECIYCKQKIYLDIVEGGGVPDWGSSFGDGRLESGLPGLDYGCNASPDSNEDGTGSHKPKRLR